MDSNKKENAENVFDESGDYEVFKVEDKGVGDEIEYKKIERKKELINGEMVEETLEIVRNSHGTEKNYRKKVNGTDDNTKDDKVSKIGNEVVGDEDKYKKIEIKEELINEEMAEERLEDVRNSHGTKTIINLDNFETQQFLYQY
ncbi:hypothetical protein MHBO_000556 [Bonamia ostreae]|uniref:Uncharacterized protein n=1 Tax=Bonamia ostreae TaxID=126728 RepID=A0ABV2AG27_9EUKA